LGIGKPMFTHGFSIPAAGIIRDKPILEHTEKDWRDTIDVNVGQLHELAAFCTDNFND
jgi:NADP-dependent 3-hydroxy acid dehydrogenase YdfG